VLGLVCCNAAELVLASLVTLTLTLRKLAVAQRAIAHERQARHIAVIAC